MAKNDPLASVPLFVSVPDKARQRLASTMREAGEVALLSMLLVQLAGRLREAEGR